MQALINTGMAILSVTELGQVQSLEKLEEAAQLYMGAGEKQRRYKVDGDEDRGRSRWWEKLRVEGELELCDGLVEGKL